MKPQQLDRDLRQVAELLQQGLNKRQISLKLGRSLTWVTDRVKRLERQR